MTTSDKGPEGSVSGGRVWGRSVWAKLKDLVGGGPAEKTSPAEPVPEPETGALTDPVSAPISEPVPSSMSGPMSETTEIPAGPPDQAELDRITDDLIAAFKTVYDPEIPVDIYELGLIYKVDIDDARAVTVDMTLTAPGCPVAGEMPGWVEAAARKVPGCADVRVNMVFDPPWSPARMSDEAKLELNML